MVAVCNLSFTLSDFPEKKKTKEGREERRKEGETNRWDNCKKGGNKRVGVPGGIQEKERRRKGRKDLLGEKKRGDRSICLREGREQREQMKQEYLHQILSALSLVPPADYSR